MGITLFGFHAFLAPLERIASWFAPRARRDERKPALPAAAIARRVFPSLAPASRNCHEHPRRALRVVRVVERGHCTPGAGRMVISGRMADVCAELDRLAALEAAAG
jgi:hypothetical protein